MSNFSLVNNVSSSTAQSRLASTGAKLNTTIQRLSSGLRINKSGDDAAGLAIANSYRSDISVLSQGVRNANDGLSALQIVDGGLNTISGLLDRAASLAAQSASGTFSGNRDTLQSELSKITSEITRQAKNIGLAGTPGGDSRYNKSLSVFIGGGVDASGSSNTVSVDLSGVGNRVDASGLGLASLNIGATALPTSATSFTSASSIGLNSSSNGIAATKITTTAATTKATGVALSGVAAAGSESIALSEQLTFNAADGSSFNVSLSAGDTGADIADAINTAAGNDFAVATYDATTKQVSIEANPSTGKDFSIVSDRAASDVKQSGLNGKNVDYTASIPASSTTRTGSAFSGAETLAANEAVTFTGADSSAFTVNLTAGDSPASIVAAINGAAGNDFVEASYDSVTKQISVASKLSGVPQSFSISSDQAPATNQTGLTGNVTYTASSAATSTSADGNVLSGSSTVAADEQLTFSGADGKIFSVNVAAGSTGAEIASLINGEAANDFVTASFDSTTGKLSLESDVAGTPQSFSVSSNHSASDTKQTGLNGASVSYTAADTISADETLSFHVGGKDFKVELSRGDSADNIIAKINGAAGNTYGIVASKDANGNLQVNSSLTDANSASFTVTSNRTAGTGSSGLNNISSSYSRAAISADENLTFSIGGNDVQVALKSGDTSDVVASKINAAVGQYGIKAELGSGSNAALNTLSLSVDFNNPNAANISVASDQANGAGATGLDGAAITISSASGGEAGATAALEAIKAAVNQLGQVQGSVGAGQNNLSQAIDLASTQITNFQAAESSIRDADIAAEASNLARLNTLQQAGVSALAQANQSSQALLSLLR